MCGIDAKSVHSLFREIVKQARSDVPYTHDKYTNYRAYNRALRKHLSKLLERHGLRPEIPPLHRVTLWDADHIVPVVEGGGECDLSNMRTLCWWCHRDVTAELRRRLAGKPDQQELFRG